MEMVSSARLTYQDGLKAPFQGGVFSIYLRYSLRWSLHAAQFARARAGFNILEASIAPLLLPHLHRVQLINERIMSLHLPEFLLVGP